MAQDNATINLYINNEQAKGAIAELESSYQSLKAERKAADDAGDNQKSLELQAKEYSAHQKLKLVRGGILDIEKSMASLTSVNMRQLNLIRKNLSWQMREMNQDSEEFLTTQKKLLRVEEQIASARGRNANKGGLGESIKNAWSNVMPSVGLLGVFTGAIALLKSGVSTIWDLTKTIQGDSKRAMTVFGDQLGYVEMQADKLSKKMGVTNREFVSMTTGVADLLIPLDFSREKAAAMAVDVQKLAGALNEWTAGKIGVSGVSDILTKAMLGETEGLKQLGIAVRMDSEEYKTLVKQKERAGAASTAQAQSLAILDLLYKKSADAQAAYNSSGNELLRFQNSAARGWRSMTESIAEWFAMSSEERVDKQVRSFKALNEEFDKNEKTLDSLLPTYNDLSQKASLNANEQQQLRDAIDGIVKIIPYAASSVDKYGTVLGINTAAVDVFRESQRLLRIEMQKDVASDLDDQVQSDLRKLEHAISNEKFAYRGMLDMNRYTGRPEDRSMAEVRQIERLTEATKARLDIEKQLGKTITTMRGLGLTTAEITNQINGNKELFGSLLVNEKQVANLEKTYADFVATTAEEPIGTSAIDSLIEKKQAELKEVEKMSEATEADLAKKNQKRAKLNAELKRLQGMGVSGEKSKSYSLDSDEKYRVEKTALKQKQLAGEYSTQEEYSREMLALEIRTLEARIATNKDKGEEMSKIKEQLLDKQLAQAEQARKREESLVKIAQGGDPEADKAKRSYDDRLRAAGLFERDLSTMTTTEKAARLQIDKEYNSTLVRLHLTQINKDIERKKEEVEKKVAQTKAAQDAELAAATTLEAKKAILSKWFSETELRHLTSSEEAEKLIRAKYAEDQNKMIKDELTTIAQAYGDIVATIESDGGLLGGAVKMTEQEVEQMRKIVEKLQAEIAKLKDPEENPAKIEKKKVDVLGMSVDEWSALFSNTDGGLTALEKMAIAAKAIGDAFAEVSELMSAIEQREFKKFESTQNKKKQALDRQLAQGVISQERYNGQVQMIESETEEKRVEMERKQAERQKMLAIFSAITSTAVAVVSALGSQPFGPWNIALAAIVGAIGAVQIATIAAQPLPGLEEGGRIRVQREQDGKMFDADYDPHYRGWVDKPKVIVGEGSGRELVIPASAESNPTVRPVLDILGRAIARKEIRSINLTQEMQRVMMPGLSDGGRVPRSNGSRSDQTSAKIENYGVADPVLLEFLRENRDALRQLAQRLDHPITAEVAMTGSKGIVSNIDKYNRTRSRATIGRG